MLALIVVFLCLILLIANRADKSVQLRLVLYNLLILINGGLIVVYGLTPIVHATQPNATISMANAEVGLGLSILFAVMATLLLFEGVRRRLARFFPRPVVDDGGGTMLQGGFNPTSITHMVALVYCVYLLAETILEFVLAGGLGGMADQIKAANAGGGSAPCSPGPASNPTPRSALRQIGFKSRLHKGIPSGRAREWRPIHSWGRLGGDGVRPIGR